MVATTTRQVPLVAGDYWEFPFTFKANGVPVNMMGYQILGHINTPSGRIDLTVGNNHAAFTDIVNGKFKFWLLETETGPLTAYPALSLYVAVIDTLGHTVTQGILPIKVLSS